MRATSAPVGSAAPCRGRTCVTADFGGSF